MNNSLVIKENAQYDENVQFTVFSWYLDIYEFIVEHQKEIDGDFFGKARIEP